MLPPYYARRCGHDSPSRPLFSYFTLAHARACEYNCAKRDYKRNRGTGGPAGSRRKILVTHRACESIVIFLVLSVSVPPRRCCCELSTCSRYRARGRTIDTVIYCSCARDAEIESYIQSGEFIAEVGLSFLPCQLMIHLGTASLRARHACPALAIRTAKLVKASRSFLVLFMSIWRLGELICMLRKKCCCANKICRQRCKWRQFCLYSIATLLKLIHTERCLNNLNINFSNVAVESRRFSTITAAATAFFLCTNPEYM